MSDTQREFTISRSAMETFMFLAIKDGIYPETVHSIADAGFQFRQTDLLNALDQLTEFSQNQRRRVAMGGDIERDGREKILAYIAREIVSSSGVEALGKMVQEYEGRYAGSEGIKILQNIARAAAAQPRSPENPHVAGEGAQHVPAVRG